MRSIHSATRRPIPDVRGEVRGSMPAYEPASRSPRSAGSASSDLHVSREADFDVLVDRAIGAIVAAGQRPDPVFGPYAELNSIVRAVTFHEGRLLEWGVARLVKENAALVLMPPETALPIVPAALEVLKRNDWMALEGLRLRSEVHHRTTYTPDLFIVDRDRHSALILDLKRSLSSYPEGRLNTLRMRMIASAMIAGDWLHMEGRVAGVSRVEVAIVDGSSERRDRENGIFALDEIGELIGVPDAGAAMLEIRAELARRVRHELGAACRRAIGDGKDGSPGSVTPAAGNGMDAFGGADLIADDGPESDVEPHLADDDGSTNSWPDPRAGGSASGSPVTAVAGRIATATQRRPILVGFARGGGP